LKVLFITSLFPPIAGGSAVVYYNLCHQLGEKAVVLTTWRNYLNGELIENGVFKQKQNFVLKRIELLRPILQSAPPRHLVEAIWRVLSVDIPIKIRVLWTTLEILRKENVNVICIGELYSLSWLGQILKILTGLPCIYYIHGEEITTTSASRFYGRGAIHTLQQAEAVIVVSHFTRSEVLHRGVHEDHVYLIMNGVDVERFTPGPKDQELTERFGLGEKKVLLTVGRIEKRKGHDMVIQALPEILREIPETVYMVVGVGSDLNRIKSLARELNVTDQVIFVGRVSDEDLPRYYNTADIFVMPNRTLDNNDTEGFGLVFLEANACSKPVVGGNAGGVPDAIVDGETGILVDGKSIKAVAIAVINLLKNENLVFQIGESGRKRALTFDWKKKAQEFYAVCEKIVQR